MDLNEMYSLYAVGKIGREEFKNSIITYAYDRLRWEKNIEGGDFLISFIPVVEGMIKDYSEDLSSFKHYTNRRIDWLKLEIKRSYIKNREKCDAYQYHQQVEYLENLMISENPIEYNITKKAAEFLKISNGLISKDTTKKRFTIFVLKCSRLLDDALIESICEILDRPTSWLYDLKDKLDALGTNRIKSREYLIHRNNRLFIEINRDQEKLSNMPLGIDKDNFKKKLESKIERKAEIQRTLNRRSYGPKNEEIAKLLSIPKGTVDSSLFYMKKELTSLLHDKVID